MSTSHMSVLARPCLYISLHLCKEQIFLGFILEFNTAARSTTIEHQICSDWETPVVPVSQPGPPDRDKRGCSFVPVGVTNRDKRSIFPPVLISFLFQLYFHFNYTNKCKYILICIILVPNSLHI